MARGYEDEAARRNFVDYGCVEQQRVQGGKPAEPLKFAPRAFCECVFDDIWKVHKLEWVELMAYEAEVAKAKPGNPPKMPPQLIAAIEACSESTAVGPKPATTTTTTQPG
jgi:hypothetical protein